MKRLYVLMLMASLLIASLANLDAKPKGDDVVRILSIGNSFSVDALENHFYELATAAGKKVIVGNMYIGGCSLERHLDNALNNKSAYTYYKRGLDGENIKTKSVALETALADEQWDYVSFQQQSGRSGIYETWEASLPQLVEYVKERVPEDAVLVLHQTWAYDPTSTHKDFYRYDNDQAKMYASIMDAVKRTSKLTGIKTVIPSGTAIQNARTAPLDWKLTRDGYHLHKVNGRYIAACTWMEVILKVNPVGNTYCPEGMTPEQQLFAQKAAHKAVKSPWKVTMLK